MNEETISIHDVLKAVYENNKGISELRESVREFKKFVEETVKELRESGKNTDKQLERTDKQLEKTDKQLEKTDKQLEKTDKQAQKTEKQLQKTQKEVDKTEKQLQRTQKEVEKAAKIVGGLGNNIGSATENLFFNSFVKTMSLGNIIFHTIEPNVTIVKSGITYEFDIVLTNTELIMVVETKLSFHPNDIKQISKKVEDYKKVFPKSASHKIIGTLAGMTMPKETIIRAKEHNFFVVTQDGNDLKVLNAPDTL